MTEYINHGVFVGQKYRSVWTAWFSWVYFPLFLHASPRWMILVTGRTEINSWGVGKGSAVPFLPTIPRQNSRTDDLAGNDGCMGLLRELDSECRRRRDKRALLDQGGAAVVGKNAGRDHFLLFILHWS